MPGEFGLYERMLVRDYLEAFAAFREGSGHARIDPLAARLALDLDRPIREQSHGNKQKVGLVQAFMHEPDLLVLDEPTQGLDPLVQQTFYALIDEARGRGGTVFLSSHILPEVERVCDRVGIIREGTLLTVDDVGDLKAKALRSLVFHFAEPVAASVFASLPSVVGGRGPRRRRLDHRAGRARRGRERGGTPHRRQRRDPRAEPRGDLPARLPGR